MESGSKVSVHNALLANVLGKTAFDRIVKQSLGEHVSAVDGGRILHFIRGQLLPILLGRLARGSVCAAVSDGSMHVRLEHVVRGNDACLDYVKCQLPRSIRACKNVKKAPTDRYGEPGRRYKSKGGLEKTTEETYNTNHMNTACVNMPISSFAKLFSSVCAQTHMYMASELKSTILGASLVFSSLNGTLSSRVRQSIFQALGAELNLNLDTSKTVTLDTITFKKPGKNGAETTTDLYKVTETASATGKNKLMKDTGKDGEKLRGLAVDVLKSIRVNQSVAGRLNAKSVGKGDTPEKRTKAVARKIAIAVSFSKLIEQILAFQIEYDAVYNAAKLKILTDQKEGRGKTPAPRSAFASKSKSNYPMLKKMRVLPAVAARSQSCLHAQYVVETGIRNFVVNMRDKSMIRVRRPRIGADSQYGAKPITTQLKLEDAMAAMADFLDMPYMTYVTTMRSLRLGEDVHGYVSPNINFRSAGSLRSSSFHTRSSFRDSGVRSSSDHGMGEDWYSFVGESGSA
tara:strand:- start:733 stop:2274 length:1542 start_codon:yes stop_codon:yes gene_type:complete